MSRLKRINLTRNQVASLPKTAARVFRNKRKYQYEAYRVGKIVYVRIEQDNQKGLLRWLTAGTKSGISDITIKEDQWQIVEVTVPTPT